MSWALELRGVTKTYAYRPILRGIDLRLKDGETVAVLGANGSGKSTLLRLAAALAAPTRGAVIWFGGPAPPSRVRHRIGLVPHESLLYDGLTVEENLRFFAALYGVGASRVETVLDDDELKPLRARRARILSRGQRQRVDLARALLHEPALLLLDEPFTGLDLDAAARLADVLRRGVGARTVLFATHNPTEAKHLAGGAAVLRNGRLSDIMPPASLNAEQLAQAFHEHP